MRTCVLCAAVMMGLIGAMGAAADQFMVINNPGVVLTHGATPMAIKTDGAKSFIYQGHTYVPLKSATDFLGAGLLWDRQHERATITYRGRQFGLAVGSTSAYHMGKPVVLPVPPVMVEAQLWVPVIIFDRYFDVPVRWEPEYNRVLILGPPGWGYYQALPYPPPQVIVIIQSYGRPPYGYGPPPYRYGPPGHIYYPGMYVPAPFIYLGTTYIPLRDAADFIGAALLWDHLRNRVVITYDGREFALVIGSPNVYYAGQVIVLPAPPVIVGGYVYVPSDFFDRQLKVLVTREKSALKIKGREGWRNFSIASAPPGYVYGIPERDRERERRLAERKLAEMERESRTIAAQIRRHQRGPAAEQSKPPTAKSKGSQKSGGSSPGAKKETSKQQGKAKGAKGGGWFKAKDKAAQSGD